MMGVMPGKFPCPCTIHTFKGLDEVQTPKWNPDNYAILPNCVITIEESELKNLGIELDPDWKIGFNRREGSQEKVLAETNKDIMPELAEYVYDSVARNYFFQLKDRLVEDYQKDEKDVMWVIVRYMMRRNVNLNTLTYKKQAEFEAEIRLEMAGVPYARARSADKVLDEILGLNEKIEDI